MFSPILLGFFTMSVQRIPKCIASSLSSRLVYPAAITHFLLDVLWSSQTNYNPYKNLTSPHTISSYALSISVHITATHPAATEVRNAEILLHLIPPSSFVSSSLANLINLEKKVSFLIHFLSPPNILFKSPSSFFQSTKAS